MRIAIFSFSLAGTQQAESAQPKAGKDGEGEIPEHGGARPSSVQDRLAQDRICEVHWIWVVWRLLSRHEGGATGRNQENEGRFVRCVAFVATAVASKGEYQNSPCVLVPQIVPYAHRSR